MLPENADPAAPTRSLSPASASEQSSAACSSAPAVSSPTSPGSTSSRSAAAILGASPWAIDALEVEERKGDPETDRIRQAVRDVLGDHGWIDVEVEMAPRWTGGTLKLIPGKADVQARDVPIEVFFEKIVGIRDRLRVLEQKINAHATLAAEEKLELQGYITRCYGSLTTFNALFAADGSRMQGASERD